MFMSVVALFKGLAMNIARFVDWEPEEVRFPLVDTDWR